MKDFLEVQKFQNFQDSSSLKKFFSYSIQRNLNQFKKKFINRLKNFQMNSNAYY